MKDHEEEWDKVGCSIMCDGWKDRRERSIINFLVNSPKGSMFVESIDASDYAKTGQKMFELIADKVEEVGAHRVIQVVTDSASNNKLAGKFLENKYKHIFWTPCAAHCIDLIMEDIFKMKQLKETHAKAIKITSYIYTRGGVVNMMRKFTKGKELLRPAKTRFATAFIVMSRLWSLKAELREMFASREWNTNKWEREVEGRTIAAFIMGSNFWTNILIAIKIASPLVNVLRLVDGERKPPMGYIYEAMDRAKENIAKSFTDPKMYRRVFEIIDNRWNTQLHQPLHAAGNYLNPEFFYKEGHDPDGEIYEGLIKCIEKMYPSEEDQEKLSSELDIYRLAQGSFGTAWAIKHRITKAPAVWWELYGKKVPTLQRFAKRVLSLTCSSSGCERNFSIFEDLHSKKRNKLDQKRLNDLVYVKYNRALNRRFDPNDMTERIDLAQMDESCEFLTGILNEDIARASGADEPNRSLRSNVTTPTPVLAMKKNAMKKRRASYAGLSNRPIDETIHEEEDDDEETEFEEESTNRDVPIEITEGPIEIAHFDDEDA